MANQHFLTCHLNSTSTCNFSTNEIVIPREHRRGRRVRRLTWRPPRESDSTGELVSLGVGTLGECYLLFWDSDGVDPLWLETRNSLELDKTRELATIYWSIEVNPTALIHDLMYSEVFYSILGNIHRKPILYRVWAKCPNEFMFQMCASPFMFQGCKTDMWNK